MTLGKVLVIEDEPTWQRQISQALIGYDLQTTPTVEEAKQYLDQARIEGTPFQVITLDISLERSKRGQFDKSGERLLNYIKSKHPNIKCVVVSGTANVDQVSDYFSKFSVLNCFSKRSFDAKRFREYIDSLFLLGKYRIIKELGRGAMGVVYSAEDTKKGVTVALKVLNTQNQSGDKRRWLDRFRHEAKTMQSLRHTCIVTVYDYVVGDNSEEPSFIVMEYLAGPTLIDLLQSKGRLSVEQVLRIGIQLFDALAYAHGRGVIHRDIKPSNLILVGDCQLKVTDFGIAKVIDSSQHLTLTQEVLGTFGYMPTEQLHSTKMVDHRADIYAAGVVLYQALSGELPYKDFKWNIPPRPFSEIGLIVDSDLEKIILKAMAPDPEDRYQNADTVRDLLKSY
jgi:serine/threonine protein kinase